MEHGIREHPSDLLFVLVLHGDRPPCCGFIIGCWVGTILSAERYLELVYVVGGERVRVPEDFFAQRSLGGDVQTNKAKRDRVSVPANSVRRHLQHFRRPFPSHLRHSNPVWPNLLELGRIESCGDVWAEIVRRPDLIEQLGGHRSDRHLPARSFVFADNARTVARDFGERITKPGGAVWFVPSGYLGEERIVATRYLGAAFDEMASSHCSGERV